MDFICPACEGKKMIVNGKTAVACRICNRHGKVSAVRASAAARVSGREYAGLRENGWASTGLTDGKTGLELVAFPDEKFNEAAK